MMITNMNKKQNTKNIGHEIFTICEPRQIIKPKIPTKHLPQRNFHSSLKWILLIAQSFGQIPVKGICKTDARQLEFHWMCWRTVYCLLNCTGAIFLTGTYLWGILVKGMDIFSSSKFMASFLVPISAASVAFNVNALIISLLYLKLARLWPQLMNKWADVEDSMRSYGWPIHLHIRINVLIIVILTAAIIEFTLAKVEKIKISLTDKQKRPIFEYYVTETLYPHIFENVEYSPWKGILLQIMNVLLTFAWTFNDLFIMIISTGLAVRFQQVTAKLRNLRNTKNSSIEIWREIREDYNKLSQLTKTIDEALANLILASFANNLFFILVQLFNSLRPIQSTLKKIYFFYSFGFMIIRTVSVSMYGAWIYDESKEPTTILNSISSDIYNIEIKRFIDQIKFDTVALTGRHFFFITRGLILSMAGAIVTYELVMIQFNVNLLQEERSETTV